MERQAALPALNGSRSRCNMCDIWLRQPFSAAKPLITKQHPRVKKSANLLGDSSSVGSPMKKAINRNRTPPPRKEKK